ncbi:MAG TPA: Gfo/Idh/MocA family oxidoreductase, partial [bacterium]|nr:Gfo/Idh/MocA family oxidoreductase [bacterium]
MKEIKIALVGYKFMGKAHSFAYRNAGVFFDLPARPVMQVLCGRSEKPLRIACEKFGWAEFETDWKKVVKRSDIDLIDVATPPNAHKDIVIEAAREGKVVFCEKP